jgi:hypothetical protein
MIWLVDWLTIAVTTAVASYLVATLVVELHETWRRNGRL